MTIKFKDGHEIEFKKHGRIWLAESVIWEGIRLNGSLDELRKLKDKTTQWFEENAPKRILRKYNARLPLWEEILPLVFKDRVAYREGRLDQVAYYLLGDEEWSCPFYCGYLTGNERWGFHSDSEDCQNVEYAIRLCLAKKK